MLRQQVLQGLWVHRFNNYTIDHLSVGVIGWYFRYQSVTR